MAFIHRKSIILQCRVVYVVRGGEMYRKSVRVIERGEGPPKTVGAGEGRARGSIRGYEKRKMMDVSTDY